MDTKSLAKSKRAHTQHHNKRPCSVIKAKGLVGSEKNQTTKTSVLSRRITALPSNCDRYDNDEDDEELSNNQVTDTVLAKSKGGDYLHLLSEAKDVSESKIDCLSSSLDDLLHDEFSREVGSMISASGEGILSWMEDDSFVVDEDGSASYHEPGFLSLDLNALARTLEKVDLHERLYLKADLLPPELCTSDSKVSRGEEQCRSHITQDAEAVTSRGESSVVEAESLFQVEEIPIKTGQSEKSSGIEADLDFLLDSVCSNSNASSNQNPTVPTSSAFETELDSLLDFHSGSEAFNKPVKPSNQKIQPTDFDDELDDLLESTSVPIKPQQDQTSSSPSVWNSKVLDEFDSWLGTI